MEISISAPGLRDLSERFKAVAGRKLSARAQNSYVRAIFKEAGAQLTRNAAQRMNAGRSSHHTGTTAEGIRVHELNAVAGAEVLLSYGISEQAMGDFPYNKSAASYPASSALTQEVGRRAGAAPPVSAILNWLTDYKTDYRGGPLERGSDTEVNRLMGLAFHIAKGIGEREHPGQNAFFRDSAKYAVFGEENVPPEDFHTEDWAIIEHAFMNLADALVDKLEGRGEV